MERTRERRDRAPRNDGYDSESDADVTAVRRSFERTNEGPTPGRKYVGPDTRGLRSVRKRNPIRGI